MSRRPLASLLRAVALAAAGAALGGCILEEEDCGRGYVLRDGRCVPAARPPASGEGDVGDAADAGSG